MAKSPANTSAAVPTNPAPAETPATSVTEAAAVVPIQPNAFYKVTVNRVVEFGGHKIRPTGDYKLRGRAVIALGDAVKSYTLTTPEG